MALPKTFVAPERLFASDLNSNFESLDSAVPSAKMISGVVPSSGTFSVDEGDSKDRTVFFPSGFFSSAPNVVASLRAFSDSSTEDLRVFVKSVSSSQVVFTVYNASAISGDLNVAIRWIAVENG